MTIQQVRTTFPIFNDLDGEPLESGYIYIGEYGLNPINEDNRIPTYYDDSLQTPCPQPIRTVAGYPSRNGSPAQIYTNQTYSIVVQNKNKELIYSSLSPVLPLTSANLPWVNVTDYGDGSLTDETLLAAITDLGTTVDYTLLLSKGEWVISNNLTIPGNFNLQFQSGAFFTVNTGITLTLNCSIDAPYLKIFNIIGALEGEIKVDKIYPEWFGAVGDGVTDDAAAIQSAMDYCFTTEGRCLYFLAKTYAFASTLNFGTGVANKFGGKFVGEARKQRQTNPIKGTILLWTGIGGTLAIDARGEVSDSFRIQCIIENMAITNGGSCDYGIVMQYNQRYTIWKDVEITEFNKANMLMGENWIIRFYNVDLRKGLMDGFATPDGSRHSLITGGLIQNIDWVACNVEQSVEWGMFLGNNTIGVLNFIGGTLEGNSNAVASTNGQIALYPGNNRLNFYGTYFEWGNQNDTPLVQWIRTGVGGGMVNLYGAHVIRKNAVGDFQTSGAGLNILSVNIDQGTGHFDNDGDPNLWVDPTAEQFVLLNDQTVSQNWATVDGGEDINFGPSVYNAYTGTSQTRRAGQNVQFIDQGGEEKVNAGFHGFIRTNFWSSGAATNKDVRYIVEGVREDVTEPFLFLKGQGSPEGVVTATVGSLYTRSDGGTNSTLYVKESGTGNTGWAAI